MAVVAYGLPWRCNQTWLRSRAKVNEERQQIHARNLERIEALAKCKLNTKAIAERTGLSVSTVGRIIREIRDAKHAASSQA